MRASTRESPAVPAPRGPLRGLTGALMLPVESRAPRIQELQPDEAHMGERPQALVRLQPGQRITLEVGSCVVLSAIGLGFQLGGWPVWTFAAGIGVYLAWVVLYAEVTVQAKSRPALWQRRPWHDRRRPRIRLGGRTMSESAAHPAQEQRTA